jgi:hypothetical protein
MAAATSRLPIPRVSSFDHTQVASAGLIRRSGSRTPCGIARSPDYRVWTTRKMRRRADDERGPLGEYSGRDVDPTSPAARSSSPPAAGRLPTGSRKARMLRGPGTDHPGASPPSAPRRSARSSRSRPAPGPVTGLPLRTDFAARRIPRWRRRQGRRTRGRGWQWNATPRKSQQPAARRTPWRRSGADRPGGRRMASMSPDVAEPVKGGIGWCCGGGGWSVGCWMRWWRR